MKGSSKLVVTVTGEDLSSLMGLHGVHRATLPRNDAGPARADDPGQVCRLRGDPRRRAGGRAGYPRPDREDPDPERDRPGIHPATGQGVGYVFYIEPGPVPGTSQAYWGPQVRIGIPQPRLNVNMDAWTNVDSLSSGTSRSPRCCRSCSSRTRSTRVDLPDPDPVGESAQPAAGVAVPIPQQVEDMDDTANLTPAEALMRGMARAVETADVVTGEWHARCRCGTGRSCRPAARRGARRRAGLRRPALRREHAPTSIKLGEYKQSFTLKRNALISTSPVVRRPVPYWEAVHGDKGNSSANIAAR